MPRFTVPTAIETGLFFDGSNDYITCSNSSVLVPSSQLTLGVWFLPAVANVRIFSKDNSLGGKRNYLIKITSSKTIEFDLWTSGASLKQLVSDEVVTLNKWHHLVCVYDGSYQYIYINGALSKQSSLISGNPDVVSPSPDLEIGRNQTGPAEFFKGYMSDAFIGSSALTLAQVKDHYYNRKLPTSGIVSRWKLNEQLGTTAIDSVGSNTGTITGPIYSNNVPFQARNTTDFQVTKNIVSYSTLGAKTHNYTSFLDKALWTYNGNQYCIFVEASGKVIIGKKTIAATAWTLYDTGKTTTTSDSHYVAVLGISSDGYIHIVWDVRNSTLNYARSNNVEDPSAFTNQSMSGSDEGSINYPRFFIANNTLFFSWRSGTSSLGHQYLNQYSNVPQTWSALQHKFVDGGGAASAYVDNFAVDSLGRIHTSFMWRTSNAPITHQDYGYAYSDDNGTTWKKSNGSTYTMPITQAQADTFDAGTVDGLINQHHIDVDSNQLPHIAYWKNASNGHANYYHAWFNGSSWVKTQITNYDHSPTGVSTDVEQVFGRAGILVNRNNNRVFVFGRSAENDFIRVFYSDYPYTSFSEKKLGTDGWGHMEFGGVDYDRWHTSGVYNLLASPDITTPASIYLLTSDLITPESKTINSFGVNRQIIRDLGTSLDFAMSTNNVTFADSNSLDLTTNATWSAWINPTTTGAAGAGRILDKKTGANGYLIQLTSSGQYVANLNNTNYFSSSNVITLKRWQHIAITFDSTAVSDQIKFYVNGVAAGVATRSSAMTSNTDSLIIGNRADLARGFDGLIDELKIYNRTLSASEILDECYGRNNSTSGLVLYTKFDEGSGTSAIDSSGTQPAGSITGATYSTDVFIKSRSSISNRFLLRDFGTCLSFNGTSSNVNCGNSNGLNTTGDVSFCFWYRLAAKHYNGGPRYYVIRKDKPYIVNFNPNGTFEVALHNGTSYIALATDKNAWEAGEWHHLAFTSSTTTGRVIYLDGVNIKSSAITVTPVGTSSTLHIGSQDNSSSWFNGQLDEVVIYHKALSSTEVSDMYWKGIYSTDNMKGFYKFDEGSGTTAIDYSDNGNTGTIANAVYLPSIH